NSEIKYAIMRTGYGTGTLDTQFERNWAESERVGIIRGVYHFFRANQDVVTQARIMLDRMGPMRPGMLPPTIDIERSDGEPPAVVRRKTLEWIAYVEEELGVRPMIYTRANVWDPLVGSEDYGAYPLWVAHYGTECPDIPRGWETWTFHQYTETGRAAGVDGPVDRNRFNGTLDDLHRLAGVLGGCGDGFCSPAESPDECPADCPTCEAVPAEGGVVSEQSLCFEAGGPRAYWRDEDFGYGGHLYWTHTTNNDEAANYARWLIRVEATGDYRLEAHVTGPWRRSVQADYLISDMDGERSVQVDQNIDGWLELGVFTFEHGTDFDVRLDDNTGEENSTMTKLVADDLRLIPIAVEPQPDAGVMMPMATDAALGDVELVDMDPETNDASIEEGMDGGASTAIDAMVALLPDGSTPETMLGTNGASGARSRGGCSTAGDSAPSLQVFLASVLLMLGMRRRRR
ncbi:MAG: GH25 family lysozyme, partial [Bradymonadia bacterium]